MMDPTLPKAASNLKRRARHSHAALPALWLVTDETRLTSPVAAVMKLPRGSGVIFRHYGAHDRSALSQTLFNLCRQRGLTLLIAGDWALAARIGADGLHLAEHAARGGLSAGAALWLRHRNRILTVAAHGPGGLRRAKRLNAQAAILAPVFATASHPGGAHLGAVRTARYVRDATLPVIALGGVTTQTINALHDSACAGIAGISFALENAAA